MVDDTKRPIVEVLLAALFVVVKFCSEHGITLSEDKQIDIVRAWNTRKWCDWRSLEHEIHSIVFFDPEENGGCYVRVYVENFDFSPTLTDELNRRIREKTLGRWYQGDEKKWIHPSN